MVYRDFTLWRKWLGLREVQNMSCDIYMLRSAPFTKPFRKFSFAKSPESELEGIRKEGFVLYKALTQTSSWVSCDSNPFICSPSLATRHLPNMLIYANKPSYPMVQRPTYSKIPVVWNKNTHHTRTHWQMIKTPRSVSTRSSKFLIHGTERTHAHFNLNLSAGLSFGSSCFRASQSCQYELERRLLCLL